MFIVLRNRHPDVERREQRKNIRLDSCYKNLNQADEQHHQRRPDTDQITAENERQHDKAQQHNVPSRNSDKQSDHQ